MSLPTINDVSAVDPVLTNMLIGYQQAENRFVASQVATPTNVAEKDGTYYIFTKKYFFLDDLQERAPGTSFAQLPMGTETATYSTKQYGGEFVIPFETEAANQAPLSLEQAAMRRASNASMIRKENAFASVAMVNAVWGTTDNNSTTDWDDTTSGDPVADVQTAIDTVGDNTGYDPNALICGRIVAKALKLHPDIIDRIKYTQMAGNMAVDAALSEVLGLRVLVGKGSYNGANEGQAFSASKILDDDALICYVDPSASIFDATAMKAFAWNPGGGMGAVTSYIDQSRRSNIAQHIEQWQFKITASDLGYLFLDVV